MLIDYARVSTQDQNPQLQHDALLQAGSEKILVLPFFVVSINSLPRGRNKQIMKPIVMIDKTVKFVSR